MEFQQNFLKGLVQPNYKKLFFSYSWWDLDMQIA